MPDSQTGGKKSRSRSKSREPKRSKSKTRSKSKSKKGGDSSSKKSGGKRKLNIYMKFMMKVRPDVVKAHPNLDVKQIAKKIGEMYRKLTAEEKKKYE